MSDQRASLYVVATPIGNLGDITLRALEVLRSVDAVVSENVQKTRNLLGRYEIATRVLSYREENAARAGEVVLGMLERGESVALVAEAGTPGVSDPGRQLVGAAWERGFRVVPVPGASAAIAAVSVTGLDEPRFVFEGFLPRRGGKRRQRLRELADDPRQLVIFEAPHRLLECLADIKEVLGDRSCLVGREMTKMHEEIGRARISDFIAKFTETKPLGEFVIVCEGSAGDRRAAGGADLEGAVAEARNLVAGGARSREAAKTVARQRGLKTRDIYTALLNGRRACKPERPRGGPGGAKPGAKGEGR